MTEDREQLDRLIPRDVAKRAVDTYQGLESRTSTEAMQRAILRACQELGLHRHVRAGK